MKSNHVRLSIVMIAAACAPLVFTAPAHADASCNPVYDAGIKQMQTPHHVLTNRSAHGNTAASTAETTFADGVVYTRLHGQWQRSQMTAAEMLQRAQDKRREESSDETCRALGDEAVDGETATVYTLHNDAGADSRLWVLKANGLLLRQSITLPDGSLVDSRYDYTNVAPPAGVR